MVSVAYLLCHITKQCHENAAKRLYTALFIDCNDDGRAEGKKYSTGATG